MQSIAVYKLIPSGVSANLPYGARAEIIPFESAR